MEIKVETVDALQVINRVEIDMQISTAKQYPRDVNRSLSLIKQYAGIDPETAEDCFYALPSRGANEKPIEGLSVRMAEIIVHSWGNLRVQTRIIKNDGKTITAQGNCHDLETNVAISVEVQRRITYKNGKTYTDDMLVVAGNAASAIAFRNAVLKVIPKAVTRKVMAEIKAIALKADMNVEEARDGAIAYFAGLKVTVEMIFKYLGVKTLNEITKDKVILLRSIGSAIKRGEATIEGSFEFEPTVAERRAEMHNNPDEPNFDDLP